LEINTESQVISKMKKLMLVAVVAAFGMVSCKKDYTCECTVSGATLKVEYSKVKKKDAETSCDSAETTYKQADASASCTLK
jgi:hypothetical protein